MTRPDDPGIERGGAERMTGTGLPTAAVVQILEAVAHLAWGRFGTGSTADGPGAPLIVWRYHDEPSWAAEALQRAVTSFAGQCEWVLEKPGRNWVLWPEREKREFESGSWSSDAEYLVALAEQDPEFCDLATADLRELIEHIAVALQQPPAQGEASSSDC